MSKLCLCLCVSTNTRLWDGPWFLVLGGPWNQIWAQWGRIRWRVTLKCIRIISPCTDTVVDAVGCLPLLLRSTFLGFFIHYPLLRVLVPSTSHFLPPPSPLPSRANPVSLTCSLLLQSLQPPSNKNYKNIAPLPPGRTTLQCNSMFHNPAPAPHCTPG